MYAMKQSHREKNSDFSELLQNQCPRFIKTDYFISEKCYLCTLFDFPDITFPFSVVNYHRILGYRLFANFTVREKHLLLL